MRNALERLLDIKEAIERIEKYVSLGKDKFYHDELIQNWITHHLQIIGEAFSRLSNDLQNTHPDIPWSKIIGMRNILVHDYFEVDLDIVWDAVIKDIPSLKETILIIIKELS